MALFFFLSVMALGWNSYNFFWSMQHAFKFNTKVSSAFAKTHLIILADGKQQTHLYKAFIEPCWDHLLLLDHGDTYQQSQIWSNLIDLWSKFSKERNGIAEQTHKAIKNQHLQCFQIKWLSHRLKDTLKTYR